MPSHTYLSAKMIPEMYERVRDKIKHILFETGDEVINLTTELWSDMSSETSLLSLTAHLISPEYRRYNAVLHAMPMEKAHTAEAIKTAMLDMLGDWNIVPHGVHLVLRDNGANMKRAMEDASFDSVGCFAHTIQLAIHDALKAQRAVIDTIAVAREIVGHFKKSPTASKKLHHIQSELNLPQNHLIQEVPTRWNSTFRMLERLVQQKTAIARYALDVNIPVITANQWNLADKLAEKLRPVDELTRNASSDKSSVAMILPSIAALVHSLEKHEDDAGIQSTTDALVASLRRRFDPYKNVAESCSCYISRPSVQGKVFQRRG